MRDPILIQNPRTTDPVRRLHVARSLEDERIRHAVLLVRENFGDDRAAMATASQRKAWREFVGRFAISFLGPRHQAAIENLERRGVGRGDLMRFQERLEVLEEALRQSDLHGLPADLTDFGWRAMEAAECLASINEIIQALYDQRGIDRDTAAKLVETYQLDSPSTALAFVEADARLQEMRRRG